MPRPASRFAALFVLTLAWVGTACAQAVPTGPVPGIDALTAFAEAAPRRPLAWGVSWDPDRDPAGDRPYLFLIGADSTVWLQSPTGTVSLTGAYVAVNVARTAAERTGYAETLRQTTHVGYGQEGGRVFFYLRQGAQTYTVAGVLLTLVGGTIVLVVWLVRRLGRERRQRLLLAEANRRFVEAREDERLRIARDLHDGPVQDLNLVNLRLAAVLPPGETQLQEEVVGIVREIRTIAEDLRPPTLGPFGLASALRAYAERFEELHAPIETHLELDDDGQTLPGRVRLALFRIAQEAMTNAAKHGRPATVRVVLKLRETTLHLEVSDDGHGYHMPSDPAALLPSDRYGLVGMRERADALGARLDVQSAAGVGTRVRLDVRRDAPEWAGPSMQNEL